MPVTRLTRNGQTHLERWVSWFKAPQHTPQSRSMVKSLVDHLANNKERLHVAEFPRWDGSFVSHFLEKKVTMSQPTYDQIEKLAAQIMPGVSPDHFLDRLLDFYSQKANYHLLREVLRNRVVDDYYKDEDNLIAIDIPRGLMPKGYGSKIPHDLLVKIARKFEREVSKESPPTIKPLSEEQSTLIRQCDQSSEAHSFIVMEISGEIKPLLLENISPPTEFSERVIYTFLKLLPEAPDGKA